MKRALATLLAAVMTVNNPMAYANDAEEKSKEIVRISHETAQHLAEDLFVYYLRAGLSDAFLQGTIIRSVVRSTEDLQKQLQAYTSQRLELESVSKEAYAIAMNEDRTRADLIAAIHNTIDVYTEAKKLSVNQLVGLNDAEIAALLVRESLRQSVSYLKQACRQGVSAQFAVPNLPPITIRPPEFTFGFNFSMSIDGGSVGSNVAVQPYASPSWVQVYGIDPNDPKAGQYAAMAATAQELATYYALDLMVKWNWIAAYSSTEAQLAAAALWSTVLVIVVLFVMDGIARNEARVQADAVEHSVRYRANAMDVARYFREVCQGPGRAMIELPDDVSTWPAPQASDVSESEVVAARLNEFAKRMNGNAGEKTQAEKDLKDYVKNQLGVAGLVRVVRAKLLDLAHNSQDALKVVREIKRVQREDPLGERRAFEAQLDEMLRRVVELNAIATQQAMERQVVDSWKLEMLTDVKVAAYYGQWQNALARYLQAVFFGRPTAEILADVRTLSRDVDVSLKEYSTPGLKVISQRLNLFLQNAK